MPRKSTVSDEEAAASVRKILGTEGLENIPESGSPLWEKISQDLQGKWKACTIHGYVSRNHHQILTLARAAFNPVKSEGLYFSFDNIFSVRYFINFPIGRCIFANEMISIFFKVLAMIIIKIMHTERDTDFELFFTSTLSLTIIPNYFNCTATLAIKREPDFDESSSRNEKGSLPPRRILTKEGKRKYHAAKKIALIAEINERRKKSFFQIYFIFFS